MQQQQFMSRRNRPRVLLNVDLHAMSSTDVKITDFPPELLVVMLAKAGNWNIPSVGSAFRYVWRDRVCPSEAHWADHLLAASDGDAVKAIKSAAKNTPVQGPFGRDVVRILLRNGSPMDAEPDVGWLEDAKMDDLRDVVVETALLARPHTIIIEELLRYPRVWEPSERHPSGCVAKCVADAVETINADMMRFFVGVAPDACVSAVKTLWSAMPPQLARIVIEAQPLEFIAEQINTALENDPERLEFLLTCGADADLVPELLQYAISRGRLRIADLLIRHGCSVAAIQESDLSLRVAVYELQLPTLRLLLNKMALPVERIDALLETAVRCGRSDVAAFVARLWSFDARRPEERWRVSMAGLRHALDLTKLRRRAELIAVDLRRAIEDREREPQ